jgi:glycosyltransferase involved in cell wall biosynthesis
MDGGISGIKMGLSEQDPALTCVAVIVPAYGQPLLTYETLHTALNQTTDFVYSVIVVNDGCPLTETQDVCQAFACSFPGKVYYLSKKNGGLSSARNCGIEFALSAFPHLEAVYFLDCDNRIGPHLLQRLLDALRESDPHIGWAYPDVSKFGFAEHGDTSGPYSALEHLFRNFCEAGSMASRRMLDAGIRFDEEMRQGVEDWEFWLHGLEKGYKGIHVPDTGFAYRRRGESMLVAAEQDFSAIKRYIRKRRSSLFSIRNVLAFETQARCRYAVFHPDTDTVSCLTDADNKVSMTRAEFVTRLLLSGERPSYGDCPGILILMDQFLFDEFHKTGSLRGILWTLESALTRSTVVNVVMERHKSTRVSLVWTRPTESSSNAPAGSVSEAIIAIESAVFLRHILSGQNDIRHISQQSHKERSHITFGLNTSGATIPAQPVSKRGLEILRQTILEMAKSERLDMWGSVPRDRYRAQTALPRSVYPELFNIPSVLPITHLPRQRSTALVLTSNDPNAIAAANCIGQLLKGENIALHLVVFSPNSLTGIDQLAFSQIITLPLPHLLSAIKQDSYQGGPITRLEPSHMKDAIGALAAYHRVISLDGGFAHCLMGSLRRLHVETWALLDCDDDDTTSIVINACAAFEQAYDAIIVPNQKTLSLCRAFGIPETKLRSWETALKQEVDQPTLAEVA